jgi:hypothetical protein
MRKLLILTVAVGTLSIVRTGSVSAQVNMQYSGQYSGQYYGRGTKEEAASPDATKYDELQAYPDNAYSYYSWPGLVPFYHRRGHPHN